MNIKRQLAGVFNLDKCLGCNTCTIACKNLWTNREGAEYMFWNNVETKPGIGYPKQWENQEKYRGGWELASGPLGGKKKLKLRLGSRLTEMLNIFYNPDQPEMKEYYDPDPYTYTYEDLHSTEDMNQQPVGRPKSMVTGEEDIDISWNANWEDNSGGTSTTGFQDYNFEGMSQDEKELLLKYEDVFYIYLPRICNHCLNPACVGACPSEAAHKREEDGIVLIDQDVCRAWRYCVTGCPYKKTYYNWRSAKMEKCILCYPRLAQGLPPACFHSCVGRIRYFGPLLYDYDRVEWAGSTPKVEDLVEAQREIMLDPYDEAIVKTAIDSGIPEAWIDAAQRSPVYKLFVKYRIALPLHPEFRTLPNIYYVPPESPVLTFLEKKGVMGMAGGHGGALEILPRLDELRVPLKYLARLLAGGNTELVKEALAKQLAVRLYRRSKFVEGKPDTRFLKEVGLTEEGAEEMHRLLAIAHYTERFVVPFKTSEKLKESPYLERGFIGYDKKGTMKRRGVFHVGAEA